MLAIYLCCGTRCLIADGSFGQDPADGTLGLVSPTLAAEAGGRLLRASALAEERR
jgi:hypothetical protein